MQYRVFLIISIVRSLIVGISLLQFPNTLSGQGAKRPLHNNNALQLLLVHKMHKKAL